MNTKRRHPIQNNYDAKSGLDYSSARFRAYRIFNTCF